MDFSQLSAPPNEAILQDEQRLYLDLLEKGGTPSAIEAGTLYFRSLFTSDLTTHLAHPENYTRLVSILLSILESDFHTEGARFNAVGAITNMACLSQQMIHLIVDQ
ncbi:hypothetical protein KIN20_022105, partial [Parelaphostrongylus tenuis]